MSPHDALFHSLEEQGWVACDTIIPADWREDLLRQGQQLWHEGLFHEAGIGRQHSSARRPEVRGDTICWIEPDSPHANHPFFAWMAQLRQELNARYYLGLRSQEFHFARYEAGQGYKKHIDQHRGSGHRKISIVLYLNPHWGPQDGGELCLYHPDDDTRETQRILPRPARLVVFRSDLIPHEVLACRQARWSLTGWLRSDEALV